MNWRKGLFRLALVYYSVVGLWCWLWNANLMSYLRASREASEAHDWNLVTVMMQGSGTAQSMLNWGLLAAVLPIPLAILTGLGVWTYRGFKPRPAGDKSTPD